MSHAKTLTRTFVATRRRQAVDHTGLTDLQLVERTQVQDDTQAFGELVRRHEGRVRALLMRLTRGNKSLADDLSQEVFLRAYRGLVGFEGRARFSTWLYRIGYNAYLNHRSRAKELASLPEGYESRVAAPESERALTRTDLRRDLEWAIAALPDRYRAVVTLYYLQDVSYPEIAEILSVPLGTVKTHLHRAKRMLRETLSDKKPEALGA